MRLIAALFGAVLAVAGTTAAQAAPAFVAYTVVSQPTLTLLGITYTASGGATVDTSGPLPVVFTPVTSSAAIPGGELVGSSTSVITANIGAAVISYTDLTLNTALGLLFADLTVDADGAGALPPTVFNNLLVATVTGSGEVLVSAPVAALLASAGIPDAEGFLVARIPAPGALVLFGLGLAALGAVRTRRAFA